jgi:hypothetical protein
MTVVGDRSLPDIKLPACRVRMGRRTATVRTYAYRVAARSLKRVCPAAKT